MRANETERERAARIGDAFYRLLEEYDIGLKALEAKGVELQKRGEKPAALLMPQPSFYLSNGMVPVIMAPVAEPMLLSQQGQVILFKNISESQPPKRASLFIGDVGSLVRGGPHA